MDKNFLPAISVILPMYNEEKYIGVCLESILIQTLQDFEVIVVDDCSTDNSAAIAENYLEKFDGRLKIISLPENTGSDAIPRNVGLEYASGKYVYFVDSDDLLIDNALETLYMFAEKYQTDVVSMMSVFFCDEEPVPKKLFERKGIPTKKDFILDNENFEERMTFIHSSQFERGSWSRFLRRKFLIKNKITYPIMKVCADVIWNLKVIFTAKKWVRIDIPLYVIRSAQSSLTRKKRTPEELIVFYTNPLINGLEYLEEFMREINYFKKNPIMRLKVMNFFIQTRLDLMSDALAKVDSTKVYKIFLSEFSKSGSTQPALISYLLVMNNLYRNELKK